MNNATNTRFFFGLAIAGGAFYVLKVIMKFSTGAAVIGTAAIIAALYYLSYATSK